MSKNFSSGVASLPTIGALAILILAVGVGLTALSLTESYVSAGQKQSAEAFFYAEAGARDALQKIARNKNYNCPIPSAGCYAIDFISNGCSANLACAKITVSSEKNPKVIISEGRSKSSIRKIRVEITFDPSDRGEMQDIVWTEIMD